MTTNQQKPDPMQVTEREPLMRVTFSTSDPVAIGALLDAAKSLGLVTAKVEGTVADAAHRQSQPVRVEERPFIKGDKVLIEGIFERMFDADSAVVMGGDGKNGIVCDLAEVHHESAQPQQPPASEEPK